MTSIEDIQSNPNQAVEDRNAWLESQLNPEGALPQVDITLLGFDMQRCLGILPDPALDPKSKLYEGNTGSIYLKEPGTENIIADLSYNTDPSEPAKMVVTDVSALEEFRGMGYGKRLYLEALKALPEGYGLVSHSMLSADGVRMWEWLRDKGVARARDARPQGQLGTYETIF